MTTFDDAARVLKERTGHEEHMARASALRVEYSHPAWPIPELLATANHIEELLTRHGPVWGEYGIECRKCCLARQFPCRDYQSTLRLLDVIDGGAQ